VNVLSLANIAHPDTCQPCDKPLNTDGSRGGRPAKYGGARGQRRIAHGSAQQQIPRLVDPATPEPTN